MNIFHCNVSLWKRLLGVLGVGLEYFLAWLWSQVLGLGLSFCKLLAIDLGLEHNVLENISAVMMASAVKVNVEAYHV